MAGTIVDLVMDFDSEMEVYLGDLPCVSAARLGLNSKAGNVIYVDSEALVVRKADAARFDYYTELTDSDARMDTGRYVLYTVEDELIATAIRSYWDMVEQEVRSAAGYWG